jgi:putative ABC transport system permease protein
MANKLLLPALRNLTKNKFYSGLNMLGLGLGMAIFLLIAQYVYFEKSYEDFIPGRDNLYRVSLNAWRNNEMTLSSAQHYPATGPAMKKEIPGVLNYARLFNLGYRNNVVIANENAKPEQVAVRERKVLVADSSFLSMMGYSMVQGNTLTALTAPNTAVITESHARIYFRNENPVGKTLRFRDDDLTDKLLTITGVVADQPANTHLKFDMLISFSTLYDNKFDEFWGRENVFTYVQLQPGTDPAKVENIVGTIINKNKNVTAGQQRYSATLQLLSSIHLHSALAEEPEANGSADIVLFIGIIGIFVLVIAWINYINLSTARAMDRAKEVGIKKVVGAVRGQLIKQFIVEAGLMNFFSLLIAIGILLSAWPAFKIISGLDLDYSRLTQGWFILVVAGLWAAGTLLSGFYPSWVLSSFKPMAVLKGKLRHTGGGIYLRKGLVVAQFVASVSLIAGTFVVYSQLNYMLKRDIGVNIDQVMVIEHPGIIPGGRNDSIRNNSVDYFLNGIKSLPVVQAASNSLTIPGKQREYKSILKNAYGGISDSITARVNSMDYGFIDVFKLKLVAGRNFSPDISTDRRNTAIVTESASHLLGFKNPQDIIGKSITVVDNTITTRTVIGVVNDYHQLSLQNVQEPGWFYLSPRGGQYYTVRVNTNDLSGTIKQVEKYWSQAFPGNPFEYFFLDDYFNRQYANEQKFGKLFTGFAIFAIIISCLGLFGLSAFIAGQRIKEIGIRKILGASVLNIMMMLSKDFLKLVLIAIIIATPAAWLVMSNWLQQFAYKIEIGLWIFAGAGSIALLIALMTVSFQAIKSALANPVKSLRSE